jgi:hypothetical protein
VLEKAGYLHEARLRKSVVKEGRVGDQILYARIVTEAEEQRVVEEAVEALGALRPESRWARALARGLGCGCPEEVFSQIRIRDLSVEGIGFAVEIGARLLIGIEALRPRDEREGLSRLRALLEAGRGIRDREGLNRFRLVMLGDPERFGVDGRAPLPSADALGPDGDDRLHLHFFSPRVLLELL